MLRKFSLNVSKSLLKHEKRSFSMFPENEEDEDKAKIFAFQKQIDLETERRILKDAKEKEILKRAHDEARKRYEQIKKGNKMYMINLKVPGVEQKPEKTSVYGLNNGFFSVNGLWVPGSVLLFPNRVYCWGVTDAHDIQPHTLDILRVIKPKPNYLIIGTGRYAVEFDESFYQHFRDLKIHCDILPTFEACAQFNLCNEDDMDVCCALIPHNL